MTHHPTGCDYSPHDQLPAPIPMKSRYLTRHFYENTAKHLVKDTVRIMANGLHIDLNKVVELEKVLDDQLTNVECRLGKNKLIQEYIERSFTKQIAAYKEERKTKLRDCSYYKKVFNYKDMFHRSFFMLLYSQEHDITQPTDEVVPGIPKWPVKLVKRLSVTRPLLARMLEGKLSSKQQLVKRTEEGVAKFKADLHNKSYLSQIDNPKLNYPKFNPNSSKQIGELFGGLGLTSQSKTKKGAEQWNRQNLLFLQKTETDECLLDVVNTLIDSSTASVIRSNFIESFYNYTVDSYLYGNYRLLGAKTARYTSNSPNMLNMPSGDGNPFAAPLKRCFTAPDGFIVATIDLDGLEDKSTANLTHDAIKTAIFLEGLDGHSVAACVFSMDKVATVIGTYSDTIEGYKEASKLLKAIVDDKSHPQHKLAKSIRSTVKPISFKLA